MLSWTAFNKPLRITTAGSTWVEFSYNADQERVLQSNDGGDKLVYIAGSVRFEHEKRAGGQDVYTHYLGGAGGSFGIVKSHAVGGVPSSLSEAYLHRDHLGSVTLLTHIDANQQVNTLVKYSYDVWGKRRNADWTDASTPIVANETIRGYTGHEMLDTVGLVHMNGRVYDAELGRMLSADPFVPEAVNPQAFNRYSYVLNNPLSYTDPSGFFFKKLFRAIGKVFKSVARLVKTFIRVAATIAVAYAANQICGPACAGFASGLVGSGGDLKAGLIGGITGGILGAANLSDPLLRAVAHGAVQGAAAEAQGGGFLSGFLAGAVGGASGGWLADGDFSLGKLTASAVLGGVTARLGGGKFANGAVGGAFAYTLYASRQAAERPLKVTVRDDGTIEGWRAAVHGLQALVGDPHYRDQAVAHLERLFHSRPSDSFSGWDIAIGAMNNRIDAAQTNVAAFGGMVVGSVGALEGGGAIMSVWSRLSPDAKRAVLDLGAHVAEQKLLPKFAKALAEDPLDGVVHLSDGQNTEPLRDRKAPSAYSSDPPPRRIR